MPTQRTFPCHIRRTATTPAHAHDRPGISHNRTSICLCSFRGTLCKSAKATRTPTSARHVNASVCASTHLILILSCPILILILNTSKVTPYTTNTTPHSAVNHIQHHLHHIQHHI
eukprot:jgi/Mesvir1/27771/Mv26401-RA.1